jgi:hypothetical protein
MPLRVRWHDETAVAYRSGVIAPGWRVEADAGTDGVVATPVLLDIAVQVGDFPADGDASEAGRIAFVSTADMTQENAK